MEIALTNWTTKLRGKYITIAGIVLLIVGFLFSVQLIGFGVRNIGQNLTSSLLLATSNPFIGLFIGLLVTAILQSSSTTTTMTVALVAAGSLPLTHAVPIVIGANIGTTITSTLVSLSYVTKTNEFVKAFSAGIVHDFFNIIVALIIFPLELKYELLSKLSATVAGFLPVSAGNFHVKSLVTLMEPIGHFMIDLVGPLITVFLGVVFLLIVVKVISKLIYQLWEGKTNSTTIFKSRFQSFSWGLIITSAIQSSSLSTSLIVPLVATGRVQIQRAFAFIIGANLGTTVTALIAALFKSEVAISLALAHLIFNLIGCVLFVAVPYLFRFTSYLAGQLAILTLRNRMIGLAYIIITFFILPFTLIYFSQGDEILVDEHPLIDTTEIPLTDLQD